MLWKYREALLSGLWVTLTISGWVWLLGIVGGLVLGVAAARFSAVFGRPLRAMSSVITAIPAIVILFWLHYPLQQALQIVISPVITAIVALAVVNALGVAEIVRIGLEDFPYQNIVAAKVCGLGPWIRIRRILLPLVVRQLLPGIMLLQVTMLQATIFASLISVNELFRVAQRINSEAYRPVEIYTGLALFFVIICLPLNLAGAHLRRRFTVLTTDR